MNVSTYTSELGGSQPSPLQRERRPSSPLEATLIKTQAVGAGLMLGLATTNLITDVGTVATGKAVLLAATASIAAYAVNRFAVEKGAELASRGFKLAAATGITGILAAGVAMSTSTYSGLVLPDVQQRRLQDHGIHLVTYVGQRNEANLRSAALEPLLKVNATDLAKALHCEIQTSCVSRQGEGGRGPIAKVLDPLAAKASAVLTQFEAGRSAAVKRLEVINSLLTDYQKTLSRNDINVWQRQGELTKVQAQIEQEAGALVAALPISLLRAYAAELAAGINMPDRPEAAERINAILKKHSEAIQSGLSTLASSDGFPPAFPGRVGVSDTFHHIGDFASIAAVVVVAELMLPLTIWLYAFLGLRWRIEQGEALAGPKAVTTSAVEYLPPPPPAPPPGPINNIFPASDEASTDDAPQPRRRGRPPGKRT